MPVLIASVLRYAVMAIVSAIPITVAQEFLDGTVKQIVEAIKSKHALSEEEAKDIVVNILVDLAANAAILGTVMKTKIALKTADYLGFSLKGFSKRKLTAKAEVAVADMAAGKGANTATELFKFLQSPLAKIAGFIWLVTGVANVIEPGIYKPEQTNAVYDKLGIPFQYPTTQAALKPGPFDSDAFKDYANAIEAQNIGGFEYGFPIGSVLYSRKNLAELIDYVYGKEIIKGNALTSKQLIPLLAPYLIKSVTATPTTTTKPVTTTPTLTTPKVQVFTGVLSQGVLGKGLEFQARPDDLIENAQEMLDAASNNLAPFIAALPNRITYQVRVVNSITTKEGFTQKGSVTQIITGYDAKGVAKYKTVVNKFAVLDISILNDKNTHVKITTIVLGPVDSVKFQVGQNTLTQIQNGLQKVATTSNIGAIKGIETVNPVTVTTPQSQIINNGSQTNTPAQSAAGKPIGFRLSFSTPGGMPIYTADDGNFYDSNGARLYQNPKNPNEFALTQYVAAPVVQVQEKGLYQIEKSSTPEGYEVIFYQPGVTPNASLRYPGAPAPSTDFPTWKPVTVPKAGASASNLSEWYQANGKALPSLAERAQLYQQYGLGQSAYYTGTAEQNTNLLNKLKSL